MTENVAIRIYTPDLSPNVLVYEDACDSIEEHDRLWAAYNETPQAQGTVVANDS